MLLSRKWLNEFVPVEAKDRAFAEDMLGITSLAAS